MILVTQGHEHSIALEVFLKSFSCLSSLDQKKIVLYTVRKTLEHNLNLLQIPFSISMEMLNYGGSKLQCRFVKSQKTDTTDCLLAALDEIKSQDILFTLPSIKSDFWLEGKNLSGHTEFFREYYKSPNLSMFFYSERMKALLITDHLPLRLVSVSIHSELIVKKVLMATSAFDFNKVVLSGINPHVGENGLLGNEDAVITDAATRLKMLLPKTDLLGPLSGDTLHRYISPKNLLVYMFHDQGLSIFKSQAQGLSINCTLGLSFLRLSVDHGTAQEIFGKNQANYKSCLYGLAKAIEFHEHKIKLHKNQ